MNESSRVAWWKGLAVANPELQQFGQPHSRTTTSKAGVVGAKGCTQTILQLLALGWLGLRLTPDDVSRLAGYPSQRQIDEDLGMFPSQVERFMTVTGLPYKLLYDATHTSLMRRANLHGPVAFGGMYSEQPEWYGFTYRGTKADGKPNGYASPRGHAGKTQLTGFTGAHFEALLGYHVLRDAAGNVTRRIPYVKDPDHGSALRPERPPYDAMTATQFRRLYESFLPERRLYAFVPTRVFER